MGVTKVLWISRHSPLPEERDELIKDLKQALIDVIDVVSEVHDNNENCPYCGMDWVTCENPADGECYHCPNEEDCAGNKAEAVMDRATDHLNITAFRYWLDT